MSIKLKGARSGRRAEGGSCDSRRTTICDSSCATVPLRPRWSQPPLLPPSALFDSVRARLRRPWTLIDPSPRHVPQRPLSATNGRGTLRMTRADICRRAKIESVRHTMRHRIFLCCVCSSDTKKSAPALRRVLHVDEVRLQELLGDAHIIERHVLRQEQVQHRVVLGICIGSCTQEHIAQCGVPLHGQEQLVAATLALEELVGGSTSVEEPTGAPEEGGHRR